MLKPIKVICSSNQLSHTVETSCTTAMEAETEMLALRRMHGKFASISILGRNGREITSHRLKAMVKTELTDIAPAPPGC